MSNYTVTSGVDIGPWFKSYIYDLPTIPILWLGNGGVIYEVIEPRGGGKIKSDADQPIASWWRSKRLDFGDQLPDLLDKVKTVDCVVLEYIDKDADTPVAIHISVDGGITWGSKQRLIGTGDGKQKTAEFYFLDKETITGNHFTIKVESVSSDKAFTWTGLYLKVRGRGKWFEV